MNAIAPKRILAFLIDILIYVILWMLFYFNFHLTDYLAWLMASSYLLLKDGLIHGQSFGKYLLKLQVVDAVSNIPISNMSSIERNVIFVVPNLFRFIPYFGTMLLILVYLWETYLIYTHEEGQRWGDQFAKTRVVQV